MTTTLPGPDTLVADIATMAPQSTRVFARHGIDFCCGGQVPIHEACESRGLKTSEVLAELRELLVSTDDAEITRWDTAPLTELTAHIVATYHEPLREELPRLDDMMAKVVRVHGDRDPERIPELQRTFGALRVELESHMPKEEQVLFPMIERGAGADGAAPIDAMEHEHDEVAQLLVKMRDLTDGFTPPEGACTTWRALWAGFADLETDLHEHIHLENNVLFPRALAGEK